MSKLLNDSVWYLIGNISLKGLNLIIVPVYTYIISAGDLGKIYTLITISEGLVLISGFSLKAALQRYYLFYEMDKKKILYSAIVINQLIISLVIYSVLVISSKYIIFYFQFGFINFLLILLASFLNLFFPISQAFLQIEGKAKTVSWITFSVGVLNTTITMLLVFTLDDKVFAFILSYSVISFCQFLIFCMHYRKYIYLNFDISLNLELLSYSSKYFLSDICAWIVNASDRLMLYKISGTSASGIYSIGYKLGQSSEIVYQSVNKAYIPLVYRLFKSKDENVKIKLKELYKYFHILYFNFFIVFIFFIPLVVSFLEKKFHNIEMLLYIITLSYFFNGLKLLIHNSMSFNPSFVLKKSMVWVVTAILNLILNLILIPIYGIYGAAISTLISFFVTYIPIYYLSQIAYPIKFVDKEFYFNLILFVSTIGLLFEFNSYSYRVPIIIIYLISAHKSIIIGTKKIKSLF